MPNFIRPIWIAIRATLVIAVICGILYPLVITGIAQVAFHNQANGSLISKNGQVVGSSLIGQCFFITKDGQYQTIKYQYKGASYILYEVDQRYFQSRAQDDILVGDSPCDAELSEGSNLGPSSQKLLDWIAAYASYLHSLGIAVNSNGTDAPVPVDLVTGDFAGFDPDISEASALVQVNMVARARNISASGLTSYIENHVQGRSLWLYGEPVINVLDLNMALNDGAAS